MRLLIIEDERRTATHLQKGLSENGFTVDVASKLQIPSLPAYSRKGTEMRRFCSCRRG